MVNEFLEILREKLQPRAETDFNTMRNMKVADNQLVSFNQLCVRSKI